MAIKVTIGSREFKTKKEANEYYSSMLLRYSWKEDVTGEDLKDLLELVHEHPNHKGKIGPGILRIYKDRTEHGQGCFWAERTDGTKDNFSFKKCIDAAAQP